MRRVACSLWGLLLAVALLLLACPCGFGGGEVARRAVRSAPTARVPPLPERELTQVAEYCLRQIRAGNDAYRRFAHSFSPAQMKKMKAGGWVRYGELSATQRDLLKASSGRRYFRELMQASSLHLLWSSKLPELTQGWFARAEVRKVRGQYALYGTNVVFHMGHPRWPAPEATLPGTSALPAPAPKPVRPPSSKDVPLPALQKLKAWGESCRSAAGRLVSWDTFLTARQKARIDKGLPVKFADLTPAQRRTLAERERLYRCAHRAGNCLSIAPRRTGPSGRKVAPKTREKMFRARAVKGGICLEEKY